MNFIDVDALEASMDNLASLGHLRELYLLGNPAATWTSCRSYVISRLPILELLDGKEITRAERIQAARSRGELTSELRELAASKTATTAAAAADPMVPALPTNSIDDHENGDSEEPWCPATRTKMYLDIAAKREADEARKRVNEPQWRDAAVEQHDTVAAVRAAEASRPSGKTESTSGGSSVPVPQPQEEGPSIKQCNQGRWEFAVEDNERTGTVVLRLSLNRFLDSSLVDVDVHPTYVSVVIKGKVREWERVRERGVCRQCCDALRSLFRSG